MLVLVQSIYISSHPLHISKFQTNIIVICIIKDRDAYKPISRWRAIKTVLVTDWVKRRAPTVVAMPTMQQRGVY